MSFLSTQNVLNVSSEELLKAACCNLSESFETNPVIDVNFDNALTGVKQVQMMGLPSPYLLFTEENIPIIRGASQVYGLSFTPGTWIESLQITKGAGSVINGYESMTGQINVELKKPLTSEKMFFNLFRSFEGRNELNFHTKTTLSSKLSAEFVCAFQPAFKKKLIKTMTDFWICPCQNKSISLADFNTLTRRRDGFRFSIFVFYKMTKSLAKVTF